MARYLQGVKKTEM